MLYTVGACDVTIDPSHSSHIISFTQQFERSYHIFVDHWRKSTTKSVRLNLQTMNLNSQLPKMLSNSIFLELNFL